MDIFLYYAGFADCLTTQKYNLDLSFASHGAYGVIHHFYYWIYYIMEQKHILIFNRMQDTT